MNRNSIHTNSICETGKLNGPTLAILRHLPLSSISFIFEGCTIEELKYFMSRAVEQEEYELCRHLQELIAVRAA